MLVCIVRNVHVITMCLLPPSSRRTWVGESHEAAPQPALHNRVCIVRARNRQVRSAPFSRARNHDTYHMMMA